MRTNQIWMKVKKKNPAYPLKDIQQAKDVMSSLYYWEKVEETRDRIFLNLRCCLVTYLLEHRALDGTSTTRKQTLPALYTLFASSQHLKVDPRDV